MEAKRIGPGLEFLKMLSNNRRIQTGMEESDGCNRQNGESRLIKMLFANMKMSVKNYKDEMQEDYGKLKFE